MPAAKEAAFLEALSEQGIDIRRLEAALDSGEAKAALKCLGDLAERRYPGVGAKPSPKLSSIVNAGVDRAVRRIASELWGGSGITVADDAPVHAGGFSWILKVSYQGNDCALAVPKFTSDDYAQRIATRAAVTELLPRNLGFEIPRVIRNFEAPVAACLMTYISGENCYPRTFDKEGKPWRGEIGPDAGVGVFRKLGQMAAGFTAVTGEGFGPLAGTRFGTAAQYLESYLSEIEAHAMADGALDLASYGMEHSQLRRIIDWVRQDAAAQQSPRLLHGDLSPWNLIHDRAADCWIITDGDDARFAIEGKQIGVCLNSMRGNYNSAWIDAIAEGYGVTGEGEKRDLLKRGAAYGTVIYGLHNAAKPLADDKARWVDTAISFMAPCVRLFFELE